MYNRILVAVDGSENSKRATQHAVHLASLIPGATVELIYILDYDRIRADVILDASADDLHIDRKNRIAPIGDLFKEQDIS